MYRALYATYAVFLVVAFLYAEGVSAQKPKLTTSKRNAANYVAKQLVKENKGKELYDDIREMMAGLMLACTLPETAEEIEEDEDTNANDDQATRRNRRNRRDREKRRNRQRDRRNSNSDPRRIRVRYRSRRISEDGT